MGPDSVKRLEIWQEAVTVVKEVYHLTREWPKAEIYGLTAQVRRAAVSVPANLAEGVGRGTPAEAARFALIALGSLYELDTLLCVAAELGYSSLPELQECITLLSRRISSYVSYKEGRR